MTKAKGKSNRKKTSARARTSVKSKTPRSKTALNTKKAVRKKRRSKKSPVKNNATVKEMLKLAAKIKQTHGCAGLVWVQEGGGNSAETVLGASLVASTLSTVCQKPAGIKRKVVKRVGRSIKIPGHLPEVLAAVGHPVRLRILLKLLDGPVIYRSLQKLTKLKAGPLYHHINQLRLVGLILPKQRDLYELTRGGRNTIVAVLSMGSIIRDRRRRPV